MGNLQADTITNAAGTGAPTFSQGLAVSGSSALESGSYTTGSHTVTWKAIKIGTFVCITFNVDGGSTLDTGTAVATSAAGEVSATFRPTTRIFQLHQNLSGSTVMNASILADGTLQLQSLSSTDLGAASNFVAAADQSSYTVCFTT